MNSEISLPLIIGCCSSVALVILLLSLWIYRRKSRTSRGTGNKHHIIHKQKKSAAVRSIDYKVLEAATGSLGSKLSSSSSSSFENGFDGSSSSSHSCVAVYYYKAEIGENRYATVKKVKIAAADGSGCGTEDVEREFQNEVDLLSRIQHHCNIIRLVGHCIHGDTRYVVYEPMNNGSLQTQLHGPSRGAALTWHIRMKIALDVARGLEYLHEHCNPPVIHRDLKSSNILLDSKFNAKLSDFGLATLVDGGRSSYSYSSHNNKSNSNNTKLTSPSGRGAEFGYVAPEFLLDGKLTDKSDVYAFGVVLLELLLGRKPVEKLSPSQCQSIVTWAMPQLTDRSKLPHIVDPAIQGTMDNKHLYQVAAVAVLCVQAEPSYRPLITDVLHSLVPLVPAQLGGTLRVITTIASTLNSD